MIFAAAMDDFPTDAVARLAAGERDALGGIMSRYQHRLYRYLVRMVQDTAVAEDLFQHTWIRVWERAGTFRHERTFDSWLFAIARNLAVDWFRQKRGVSLDEEDESGAARLSRLPSKGADPLSQVLEQERGALLAEAVSRLPVIHREVLVLRFEEGMKLEEIAEVAGIPVATVKSRLSRALDGARRQLAARGVNRYA